MQISAFLRPGFDATTIDTSEAYYLSESNDFAESLDGTTQVMRWMHNPEALKDELREEIPGLLSDE